MKRATTGKQGFSLLELSIVLVVLGLIIGGIFAGRTLIRAAELRAATQDAESYMAAVYMFRDQYLHMPGDLPNATEFWGAHASLCPTEPGAESPTGTCNGDGDGVIMDTGYFSEITFFWNHLAQSGIVAGTYEMDWDGTVIPGVHAPLSAFQGASYRPEHISLQTATSDWWFEGLQGHVLRFGTPNNGICNTCFNSIPGFLPKEAWMVDRKLDDGKPGTGEIQVAHNDYGLSELGCADTNDSAEADTAGYNINGDSTSCLQIYRIE